MIEQFSLPIPIKHVWFAPTLQGQEADCLTACGFEDKVALVCDERTYAALGERIEAALIGKYRIKLVMLKGNPQASESELQLVRNGTRQCDALIAVGSGTINDLCKYTAALDEKPYVVFPTAPSMNGYASATASISIQGHKKSQPAKSPDGIFCDMDVIRHAPQRLIHSGLGDTICRSTAQTDWLLSHLVLNTPYDAKPFDWLAAYEKELFDHSAKLATHDTAIVTLLMKSLLVSGAGMVSAHGSYPASQGEHLIAHYIDMMHPDLSATHYHGEHIGVTSLTMAHIQAGLVHKVPEIKALKESEIPILQHFGPVTGKEVLEAYRSKLFTREQAEKLNQHLRDHWKDISEQLRATMRPAQQLKTVLKKAGAPTEAEELGWPKAIYDRAVSHAHFIRNRFTFLDIQYYETLEKRLSA